MNQITLIRPDDWHLHLRDGDHMRAVLRDTVRRFGRAIVMPNLRPPVTTAAAAIDYKERILTALPAGAQFEPLMTLYLTDNTQARRNRASKSERWRVRGQVLPGGCDDQLGLRCERSRPLLRRTGSHVGAWDAVARARRGHGSGGGHLRSRAGVSGARARRLSHCAFRS